MTSTAALDHASTVRQINATLQGPVLAVLSELVPEVRRLPKRTALETVLDDMDLLERCFGAFRANPEQFRHLLIDRHKMPVEDAEALLECGRSLDQVVAMVVRTAAKRHFRSRLDGQNRSLRATPRRRREPADGVWGRLRTMISVSAAHSRPALSRGELLYLAIRDYLRHDWQVPIIPEYAQMSPSLVRRLGPRLLDYRLAEDIRRLRADPDHLPPPTPVIRAPSGAYRLPDGERERPQLPPPAPITTADKRITEGIAPLLADLVKNEDTDRRARLDEVLSKDGKRLRAGAFTAALLDPKVRGVLSQPEQTVLISSVLGSVNGLVGRMLVADMGFRPDQLAVFVLAAHAALGEERFLKAFGVPGRPDYVAKVVDRAKAARLGQHSSLPEISEFVTTLFAAAEAAGRQR